MKMNRALLTIVIAMAALCAVLAWSSVVTANRVRELQAQLEAKNAEVQELTVKKRGDSAHAASTDTGLGELLAKRDTEYEELREAYDKLKQQIPVILSASTATSTSDTSRASFTPGSRRNNNNLERLRLQDPERYRQVVQAIRQRQQQATQEYEDQMAGLLQRAQAAATHEEADLVAQITDTLDKLNQLRQSRQALDNLPEDQRQAEAQQINQEMRDTFQQLNTLRDQDRTLQYQKLADQLGLKGPDVQTLVEGIPQILKSTQYQTQRGPGGPGGPGFGFGGPPPTPSTTTQTQSPSSTTK